MSDEYDIFYKIDAHDEYVNGAYDEEGNDVICDICGGEIMYRRGEWICRECGQKMSRIEFLNYIGAAPPGSDCYTSCKENYPLCKKWCSIYEIDPDDPILD